MRIKFRAMDLAFYQFSFGSHRGKNVIWIRFGKDIQRIRDLRAAFPSAKWSNTQKAWYLPDLPSTRKLLQLKEKEIGAGVKRQISEVNRKAFDDFINQLKLKAYSQNTIRTYATEFAHLLKILKNYPVDDLSEQRLKDYFLYCIKKEKIRENHLNSRINAVKFYFEQVLHKPKMFFDIPRPKKPKLRPKMLTKSEIKRIFAKTENTKHLLMLQLSYGMGLRVREIVNLKI